jgi:hypothetical protein
LHLGKSKINFDFSYFVSKTISLFFFLCNASIQNWETYPPARENKNALENKTASTCRMDVKHNKNVIYSIHQQKKYSTNCKIENDYLINWEQYMTFAITIRLNENSINTFFNSNFPLLCNFRSSKPTRTRTQYREKQETLVQAPKLWAWKVFGVEKI